MQDAADQLDGAHGSNDQAIMPYDVLIYASTPGHLRSDLPADIDVNVKASCKLSLTPQQCRQLVEGATQLVDRATRTSVAGAWSSTGSSMTPLQLRFKPAAALAEGDYLVQIKEVAGKVAAKRAMIMFHVGPMPRVAGVGFFYTKKVQGQPLEFDVLQVHFSEQVDLSVVTPTFENQVGGAWKKLSVTNTPQHGGWLLPAPLDVKLKLRVTVGQDVGAASGLKLDGLYTGKAGSGDFTATMVPGDYVTSTSVERFVPEVVY